jgi:SAM-dependent methyltransferase
MNYNDLSLAIVSYASTSLEARKDWYSPAADAYNQVRPHYPQPFISQVLAIAPLTADSKILEVGCGPGTATVAFAPLGAKMLCLEPNPHFYRLAQTNCQAYPQVSIKNLSFEEWPLESDCFDAVLAASSFHWIPAEIGYPKAAQSLRAKGHLILLWNKELQPSYDVSLLLSEVYQVHAPFLDRYEDQETQEKIVQGLGQIITDSGQFQKVVQGTFWSEVVYTIDEYLMLLNTYSPYLKLEAEQRAILFEALREKIEQNLGNSLPLSYLSAFHVAKKR